MLHVGFGGLDEVRDEVVAAFQLNIDLREGVFEAVPQDDEGVVLADDEEQEKPQQSCKDNQKNEESTHGADFLPGGNLLQPQKEVVWACQAAAGVPKDRSKTNF